MNLRIKTGRYTGWKITEERRSFCIFTLKTIQQDAAIIGVSKDSVDSHKRFAEKYNLPFTLISDPEFMAIKAYDVWQEKKTAGRISMGVVRTTYLIDEEGVIVKAFGKVKAADNPAQMLEEL